MRKRFIAVVALLFLAAAGLIAFAYSGFYNVAATKQHTGPVFWFISKVMRTSIERRGQENIPPDLADPDLIGRGQALYESACQQCHGAPGLPPSAFAKGMVPIPPSLVQSARTLDAGELYWVIANGIKMTGMPAWEYRLTESEIWAIVAFVTRMPMIVPSEYRKEHSSGLKLSPQLITESSRTPLLAAADPERGRVALRQYGCTSCHVIPGIVGPSIWVGPPLERMGARKFIAGVLPNTSENMVRWIQNPVEVEPLTAMPDMSVPEDHAKDMAAYLSTLR